MEKIEQYFTVYPKSTECFETSDGFVFHSKTSAQSHAQTLKNNQIKTHQRPTEEKENEATNSAASVTKTVAVLIKEFEAAENAELLTTLLPEGEERATVLKAYNKKLESFKVAE